MRTYILIALFLLMAGLFAAYGSGNGNSGSSGVVITPASDDSLALHGDDDDEDEVEVEVDVESAEGNARLECGEEDTRSERVRCRVRANAEAREAARAGHSDESGDDDETESEDEDDENGDSLRHMPEECRELTGTEHAACIARYRVIYNCLEKENDRAREACMKSEVVLNRVIDARNICRALEGEERRECLSELREKVYNLLRFRFQNLIAKAEKLQEKGASEELVVGFIDSMEQKAQEFKDADTIAEKKQVVREAVQLWREFVREAVKQIREARQAASETAGTENEGEVS